METPINFTAIDTWSRRYGVEGEMFDRLLRFVSEIDNRYLDSVRKAATPPPKPKEET